MTDTIQRRAGPPSATGMVTVAALAAVTLGFAAGYDPRYGGAGLVICVACGLIVLAPRLGFLAMLFLATGWPFYIGIPIGGDVPVPFMVPVIVATFISVAVRQLLGEQPARQSDPSMRLVDLGVAALTAALLISIFVNGNLIDGLKGFVRVAFIPLLLYWCCRYFVRDAETTRAGFDALLIGSCLGSAYAVFEWISGHNYLLETFAPPVNDIALNDYWNAMETNYQGIYRSHGFGMNPIFFGATSSILLIYAAARLASAESRATRLLYLALCSICGAGLIATLSRGPILAGALGVLLLAVAYKRLRVYIAIAALAATLFILYSELGENSFLQERLGDSENVTLRMKLWQTAFAMFTDNPVFGVGLGGFPQHQLDVIRRHAIGPFFEFNDGHLEKLETAEHAVLQYLAETGLVGAIAAALLIAAVARIYVPALFDRTGEPARMLIITAGTGMVVFLVQGMSVTIYNAWETAVLVPFLLAALGNVRSLRAPEPEPAAPTALLPSIPRKRRGP